MEKKVKDFLNKVKDDKKENLMGIELDIEYWKNIIGNDDEQNLRLSLELEQKKLLKGRSNKVLKDTRDMEKIGLLNSRIDVVRKANDELARLIEMKSSIHDYFSYIKNISSDTEDSLTNITKM